MPQRSTQRFALLLLFSPLLSLHAPGQAASSPYDSVDPIIGTAGDGNTFPGATLPFGMTQWSPDTNSAAWYYYKETKLYGFSMTHLSGAGCPVYGDFAVLPVPGELTSSPGKDLVPYLQSFSHSSEKAQPGYYAVTLDSGVRVEITVTERAGIARFTFPQGTRARLLINSGSTTNLPMLQAPGYTGHDDYINRIELTSKDSFSASTVGGAFCSTDSRYKLYAAGSFNQPYQSTTTWQDGSVTAGGTKSEGKHTGVWLDFGDAHEVLYKIGISYVSEAGARHNLDKELTGWDFDKARRNARQIWSALLDRIAVEGGTPDQRKIFYTGVYHSFIAPNIFSDEDGNYIGFDNKVRSLSASKQHAQYANFSDWDIYRNTVQLQALFEPERASDMMQSLVNDAKESGWYPRWPAANDVTYVMGGDSPDIVIASSYAFGAHNFDLDTALKYMVKSGADPGLGPHNNHERPFLADYLKLGYVPIEKDAIAASRTLEYASADFSIAQFAKSTGHPAEYEHFLKQSRNWENLFDSETRWIRPRNGDGSWLATFDAERSMPKRGNSPDTTDQLGFEEGNTYQYTFMIPFDYPALFQAIGGDDKAVERLDKFFLKVICWGEPCFNMANEPDFVTPYSYVFAGKPWKTQAVIDRIEKETFKTTPDGIPGNDDLGATSGVYVWNAIGFYPAVPGVGGLVLGTPLFDKATLKLAGGRVLTISRKGPGIYVQSVALDGKSYPSLWLPLTSLKPGNTQLQFTMDTRANTDRGAKPADRPPSFR